MKRSWHLLVLFLQPLSVELGPGILSNIFDGIQVSWMPRLAYSTCDTFISSCDCTHQAASKRCLST